MSVPARVLTPDPERWRRLRRPAILAQIGNTPLLKLEKVTAGLRPGVAVYVKAEWFNPGGSIKDRPALRMIEQAEWRGELTPDKTIIRLVRELVAAHPDCYYYPNQYDNDENWKAHYYGTAAEIWQQTRGRVTHFLAGIGTSGTFVGVSRRLKSLNPAIRVYTVEPADELQVIEGLKHMETAIVPRIYDPTLKDGEFRVEAEAALDMARRLVREEGLFVGFSAGAAVHAALELARTLDRGVIVTVLPDGGAKYISLGLFG